MDWISFMNPNEITADLMRVVPLEGHASPLRQLLRDAALSFRVLYAPRRILSLVVPRGVWVFPVLALCACAVLFGGVDIAFALRAASGQGGGLANAEVQRLLFTRVGVGMGIIVLGFPLVLSLRAALAALLIRAAGSGFGPVPSYRQVLTISTYALCPLLIQFTLSSVGAHAHLFDAARWSSLKLLPSLTTRFGLDWVAWLLGYQMNYGAASALNLVNPFELWKYVIIFVGMRAFSGLRPFALLASVLVPFAVDVLFVYGLFWVAS
jgi:hypothetical protein